MPSIVTIPAKQLEHKGTYTTLQSDLMDTEAGWCTDDNLRYVKINGTLVPQSKIALFEYGASRDALVDYRDRGMVPVIINYTDDGAYQYLYPTNLTGTDLIFGGVADKGYICAKCDTEGTWSIQSGPFLDKVTSVVGTVGEIDVDSTSEGQETTYVVSLSEDVKSKIDENVGAVDSLAKLLEDEITARTEGDATLSQGLANEAADRQKADAALEEKIKKNGDGLSDLEKALTDETVAREAADTALGEKIDANAGSIADLEKSLEDETTARTDADAALEEKISGNADSISNLEKALADETTARTDADAELEKKIAANTGSISDLEKALEDEAATREEADSALKAIVDTKQDILHDGDNIHIDEEKKINVTGRKRLVVSSPLTASQTESQLILGFNGDDYATQDSVQSGLDDLKSALAAEEASRISEDATLQTAITQVDSSVATEVKSREDADTKLQASIDSLETALANETTARTASDTALQEAVDSLKTALTDEVSLRTSADTALQESIDKSSTDLANEIKLREAADEQLQDNIDTVTQNLALESQTRETAISSLTESVTAVAADLETEIQNRTAALAEKQDKYYVFNSNTSTSDEVVSAITAGKMIISASGSNANEWLGSISGGYPYLYRIDGSRVVSWHISDGKWVQSTTDVGAGVCTKVAYPEATASSSATLLFTLGIFGIYGYVDNGAALRLVVKPTDGMDHAIYANGGGSRCDASDGTLISTSFTASNPYLRLYVADTGYWESDSSAMTATAWTMYEADICAFSSSNFGSGVFYRIISQ